MSEYLKKDNNQGQFESIEGESNFEDSIGELYNLRLLRHHKDRQLQILKNIDSEPSVSIALDEQLEINQQICALDTQISCIEDSLSTNGFATEADPSNLRRQRYDLEVKLDRIEDQLAKILQTSSFGSATWSIYAEEYNDLFVQYSDCVSQIDALK